MSDSSSSPLGDDLQDKSTAFSPATSQLGSSSIILQEKLGVSRSLRNSLSAEKGDNEDYYLSSSVRTMDSSIVGNPEEEETDIDEDYYST